MLFFIPILANAEMNVQPGNWVKYRMDVNVDSDNDFIRILVGQLANQAFTGSEDYSIQDLDWLKMEVLEVSESSAKVQSSASAFGKESRVATFWIEKNSNQMFDFVVPTNLKVGDRVGNNDYGTIRVTDIITRTYDGNSREVFVLESKSSTNESGTVSESIIKRYHDKTTGVLLELDAKITMANVLLGSVTAELVLKSIEFSLPSQSISGGGCLIATATFGSELAPQVQQLRELRDNSLLQTKYGSAFMNTFNEFYYSFSPAIADYERENLIFKEAVKLAITPMISSLSILNHVDMTSEVEVLGYGISVIVLNLGMYAVIPTIVIVGIKRKLKNRNTT